jgi:hypothetical protein
MIVMRYGWRIVLEPGTLQTLVRCRPWYVADMGKPLCLSETCSKNENVPNFSFLIISSAGAAGRHDFDPKMTFVVLAGASAPAFHACAR